MGLSRVAVLISGSGTNLQALIDATRSGAVPAEIALVVSNRAQAYGLERAKRAGITSRVLLPRDFEGREAFDAAIDAVLREHDIEYVCLAGYMRVLTADFVHRWHDRLLNIHPSLLPAFRGLDVHERVLEAGMPVSGCTVHFVRPEVDDGPIILQGVVPVLPEDTPQRLQARVLEVEHRCYPRALDFLVRGRLRVEGERVELEGERPGERLLLHPRLAGFLLPSDRERR